MNTIDSTSIILTDQIGRNVYIGPNCKISKNVKIMDNVFIECNTIIDEGTVIYPFVVIGTPPQDKSFKNEESYVVIGKNNIIREFTTIHRATGYSLHPRAYRLEWPLLHGVCRLPEHYLIF